jgi:hypothetical protein
VPAALEYVTETAIDPNGVAAESEHNQGITFNPTHIVHPTAGRISGTTCGIDL